MPPDQFDELAKELAKSKISRRRVLRALAILTMGGLLSLIRGSVNGKISIARASSSFKVYLPVIFSSCAAGLTNCNGTCVDLQTDANNCGACGTICPAGATCVNGQCTLLSQGSPCSSNSQCISGHCVDGFCCNTACSGTCQACSNSKTGQPDGICAYVIAGTDPDNECPDSQVCNGAGVCM